MRYPLLFNLKYHFTYNKIIYTIGTYLFILVITIFTVWDIQLGILQDKSCVNYRLQAE